MVQKAVRCDFIVLQGQVILHLSAIVEQHSHFGGQGGVLCIQPSLSSRTLSSRDTGTANVLPHKVLMKTWRWLGLLATGCCSTMVSLSAIPEDPRLRLRHFPRKRKHRVTSELTRCQNAFMPQLSAPPLAYGPCLHRISSLPALGFFPCLHQAFSPGLLHLHNLSPLLPSLSPSPPPSSSSGISFPGEGRGRQGRAVQARAELFPKGTVQQRLGSSLESRSGGARGSPAGLRGHPSACPSSSPQHIPALPFLPVLRVPGLGRTRLLSQAAWVTGLSPSLLQWRGGVCVNLGVVGGAGLRVVISLTPAELAGSQG